MQNCDPKISVIIPIYNAEKYLSQCMVEHLSETGFFEGEGVAK